MESVRFETYLRLIRSQVCTFFFKCFSRRLFAKHHTSSSLCRIFSSRSRSRKSRLFSFVCLCFLFNVVIVILILLKIAFWQISILTNHWWKFYGDRTRIKSKNIGTVSKKLYWNTLVHWICLKYYNPWYYFICIEDVFRRRLFKCLPLKMLLEYIFRSNLPASSAVARDSSRGI